MLPFRSESLTRSLIKTISWRIIATTTTILLAYLVTKKWSLALSVGILETISKTILYYLHERAWNKINLFPTIKKDISPLKEKEAESPKA